MIIILNNILYIHFSEIARAGRKALRESFYANSIIIFAQTLLQKYRYKYETYLRPVAVTLFREIRSCCSGYYQVGEECVPRIIIFLFT